MRATRRATVTATGAAVLGLAGCTDDAAPGAQGTGPTSSPTTTTTGGPDLDRVALDRAVVLTTGLLDLLAAGDRPLDPGGRFAAMHTEHLAVLDEATGSSESASPTRGVPVVVGPSAFRRRESAAQRELAHLAQEVASGALARMLAAMSAGIAAHLAAAGPVR